MNRSCIDICGIPGEISFQLLIRVDKIHMRNALPGKN